MTRVGHLGSNRVLERRFVVKERGMAVARLSTPAAYVVMLPNSSSARTARTAARSPAILVAGQHAIVDRTVDVSIGELHALLRCRAMAVRDTIYGPHVGAVALADYGCCTRCARVEAARDSIANVWGVRIIDKCFFRVGGVSFIDSVGNLGFEDVRLG